MSEVKNCYTCANAVYHERWGEWHCLKKNYQLSVLVNPKAISECPSYKKGTPKEHKSDE